MKFTAWTVTSIVFLVLAFSFYWFEARPTSIRKDCENAASSKGGSKISMNNRYRQCLIQHGMSPESIFVNLQ